MIAPVPGRRSGRVAPDAVIGREINSAANQTVNQRTHSINLRLY